MSPVCKGLPIMQVAITLFLLSVSSMSYGLWHRQTAAIMGTEVAVELWSEDSQVAQTAIDEIMAEMRRIDRLWNPGRESSELAKINRLATTSPLVISAETYQLIDKSLYYSRISHGAFDISFASVGYYYDYREHQHPDDELIDKARQSINYKMISLDAEHSSIFLKLPGMRIDLGGIAKGYAVDRGIEILQRHHIVAGLVSAGGDSRILGDRGDRPWNIGIRHPRKANEFSVILPLANTAISTSGDYERFFVEGEQRFHHIINPKTGRSATELQSVSILAPRAVDSDALSTTVFVLGVKKGLELINQLPEIDAILIDGSGQLHYSHGLMNPAQSVPD